METKIVHCDKCDKPNPIASECNYCPECRAEFIKRSDERREFMRKTAADYWDRRPY